MIKTMTAQALVPHFGYCDEIVFDEVIKLRNAVKASAAASGVKFSYLPVVIKAVSLSLLRFPQLNAKMTQDMSSLEHFASHNIGALTFCSPLRILQCRIFVLSLLKFYAQILLSFLI
jgi:2-oxoisovalerate dehydrogenase E2 component (dihydrolipoyl transacylase)